MKMRITKGRFIAGCISAAVVGLILSIGIVTHSPGAAITNRKTLRALFSMPKVIREFPVEKHIKPGDGFTYDVLARAYGYQRWRLQINTAACDVNDWKDAFRDYFRPRGKWVEPGSNILWPKKAQIMQFRPSGSTGSSSLITFKKASDKLCITFEYHELGFKGRIFRTRWGRRLGSLLRKVGIDAMTLPT